MHSHYNAIYDSQLQKTIILHTQPQQREALTQPLWAICRDWVAKHNATQPQQRGTSTQPFPCDLQRHSCKTQYNYAQRPHVLQLAKAKGRRFWTLFKGIFQRKIISVKMQKHLVPKHHLQASCSHYNTTYGSQLQKTIMLRTQPQQS